MRFIRFAIIAAVLAAQFACNSSEAQQTQTNSNKSGGNTDCGEPVFAAAAIQPTEKAGLPRRILLTRIAKNLFF